MIKEDLKRFIKKTIPGIVYRRKYWIYRRNSNKTFAEAEKQISKKFESRFGRGVNWEKPITYNEKINISKLYAVTSLKTELSDKILVRDWVKKTLGKNNSCNFIPIIGIYDSIEEIDFDKLPNRYVMKMNNDSGSVFIHDESHPITKELIASYKYFYQKRNYAYKGFEIQYKGIKPKIMIEKYMGEAIWDYKFSCFDGKCHSCRVDFDRFDNHTRNFYDKKWNILPYNKGSFKNYSEPINKPKNFEKMWEYAEKLSNGFDQVRVDFYDIDGKIYFGEMTFTNGSGFEEFNPDDMDLSFGLLWKLDMESIKKRRKKLLNTKIKDYR